MLLCLFSASLFTLMSSVYGQNPTFGRCPAVSSNANSFDLSKYVGVWYEIERTFNVWEIGLRCVTANYTAKSDGNVNVVNKGVNVLNWPVKVEGTARVVDAKSPNYMKVVFGFSPEAPYWVASTDHDNYAVVISCSNMVFGLFRVEAIWVLGRNSTLSQTVLSDIHDQIKKLGFNPAILRKVDQNNCSTKK